MVHHRGCQSSGLGILPAGVIRGDQDWKAVRQRVYLAMLEVKVPDDRPTSLDVTEITSECHVAKCQDHSGLRQEGQLPVEITAAVQELDCRRSILRRCTTDHCSDECTFQLEAIVPMFGCWLGGKS